jgi:N-acetylglutamate synthase-like GNAT family acetyltransferase
MIIREASASDIGALTDLMIQLGYPSTFENMKTRFSKIEQHPDYQTLIAVYDDKIIGMIGLSKSYFYEKDGFYIRILALVVDSNYRNKGIGKK